MVGLLGFGFAVVVDLQKASVYLFAIHLDKSRFCALMGLELDVSESFRLLCLPVVRNSDRFDLSKATEPVTDVILLKLVRKPFDEECFAILRHESCHFYSQEPNR